MALKQLGKDWCENRLDLLTGTLDYAKASSYRRAKIAGIDPQTPVPNDNVIKEL